jgi:hypothetical protein
MKPLCHLGEVRSFWGDAGRRLSFAVLLFVGAICARVRASSFSWAVDSSGSFTDSANWNYFPLFPPPHNDYPTGLDSVTFRRGSGVTYSVTFPGGGMFGTIPVSYDADRLLVGSNNVTLSDSLVFVQSSYTIDNTDLTASGRGVVVGVTASDTAAVLTTTLPFSAVAATIGDAAGAVGTLNVNGRTFTLSGNSASTGADGQELLLGNAGAGTLNINNGASFTMPSGNADVWIA